MPGIWKEEERQKRKKVNIVRYLEQGKMGKRERRLRRKVLEDPGPKLLAPPPSSRGPPNGTSKVTAERRLEVTEAPRDRQNETSGAMAALTVAGEEPGAGAPGGLSLGTDPPWIRGTSPRPVGG